MQKLSKENKRDTIGTLIFLLLALIVWLIIS
jgi:hypothetical protein